MNLTTAWSELHRYVHHIDGCRCATEAHSASDCTCGMYVAMEAMRQALVATDARADRAESRYRETLDFQRPLTAALIGLLPRRRSMVQTRHGGWESR